jgi:hypothetical protein
MYSKKVLKVASADTTTGAVAGVKTYVGNAKRIGILLRLGSHGSGNTVFTVKVGMETLDGTNAPTMTAYNMLIDNVANTNAQTLTRIASKTLSANGDAFLWVSPETPINFIEVDYNTTTDGAASVFLLLEEVD